MRLWRIAFPFDIIGNSIPKVVVNWSAPFPFRLVFLVDRTRRVVCPPFWFLSVKHNIKQLTNQKTAD